MSHGTLQIGYTSQERPLVVRFAGDEAAATRVLIVAGQHGDEPLAREAVAAFVKSFQRSGIHIAGLIDANPDGSSLHQRANGAGIDLNRDHQRLAAVETQAIHAFARQWRPHFVIDVHTYPPRRRHLLARGWVHATDVFIDIANNPAACADAAWATWLGSSLPRWVESVRCAGFRCQRYTIITKTGRIRHSTPDVCDARNGLALSLGVPAVLLEGRQPTRFDGCEAASRTAGALQVALRRVVNDVREIPPCAPLPEEFLVPIRSRYVASAPAPTLPFYDPKHQQVRAVQLEGTYTPRFDVTHSVAAPLGYLVPGGNSELLALLHNHGIVTTEELPPGAVTARRHHIERVTPSERSRRPPKQIKSRGIACQYIPNDDLIVPVTEQNARLLAVLLEPHSKYAISRYAEMAAEPVAGQFYPIGRIEAVQGRAAAG